MIALGFCDCGGMLVPYGTQRKCRVCGKKYAGESAIKPVIQTKRKKKEIAVIEDNRPDLPVADDKECSKCGKRGAYFWLIQTRSADEPPTQFFRCTSCKHTWREYK